LINLYDPKPEYESWWEKKGKFIHLTNASIQKKHPDFKSKNNESILEWKKLLKYYDKETLESYKEKIK